MRAAFSCLLAITVAGCTTFDPAATSGVAVVTDRALVGSCYPLGPIAFTDPLARPEDAAKAQAKARGGDTVLKQGIGYVGAFACDPGLVATLKARDVAREAVRITNRQDVVAPCKFLKNATVESEAEARAQTVTLGGNVFFVVSDTTRTAEQTDTSTRRPTTYNYEVRRLTGEVYSCP